MKINTLNVSALVVAMAAGAGSARAQNWRASCDNRQGTTFADVVDSSDPTQSGYNIDPSMMFIPFNGLTFPVSQNSGSNTSSASLTASSKFIGSNPATHVSGFFSNDSVTASAHRATQSVRAFANDGGSVCLDLSGASVANPVRMRLNYAITLSGGATQNGRVRIVNPNGTDFINVTSGSANQIRSFTTNGTYTLTATASTGDINITSGTATITGTAQTKLALTCVADYNGSGDITVQDIFDFLAGYFGNSLAADVNLSGGDTVQDIFDFLAVYFGGCN